MKGLPNANNTCYFNAMVQCLAYSPNLANYLMHATVDQDTCAKKKGACALSLALARFVCDYWTAPGDDADPTELFAAFQKACRGFPRGQQHDAHEAMVCVLDKVHDGLSKLKPGSDGVSARPEVRRQPWLDGLKGACSVVSEVFRGQVETRVEAPGYSSVSHDHFTCLSMAVTECASLAQCFASYMAAEDVQDFKVDDRVVGARVTKTFTHLPRVLIVHLKRFDGTAKIDRFVDYTMEMDLVQYALPGCEHHYQLFGVCLHRGSVENGHYTACCEVKGRWYHMDDDTCTPMKDINHIIQRDAYVLMYKRM